MSNIRIEPAKKEDYEQLRTIFFQSRKESFHWVDSSTLKMDDFDHSVEGELILAASVDNQIAGFISIWEEDNFIHNLFVSPEFKRFGIGRALLDEAVRLKGKPMSLKCVMENKNAFQFYLSQGWRIEKEVTDSEEPYYFMVLAE
ncbi:GNAT family N-acetyltransferase [Gorillibacterium massiliense]|uniref:GNAT family N-acetyltransferase n=1 Tax=Gorillibacterium massiliense TaxID=1280390 RepID=UPI0004ADF405|nr:GNAT family N-acetyltransferase [Gorillibacterium massiliense]